ETHIHADFVSGSRELAEQTGAKVYVSDEGDADWKYEWLDKAPGGGSYKHQLLKNGDLFRIGHIELQAIHTPGHTSEHLVFLVTDHGAGATEPMGMATGDFVFVGDLGRPDLLESAAGKAGAMEPAARRLFKTVQKLDQIPDFVQVWPAHGAGSACGKALGAVPMSTVGYERRFNPAIQAATNEQRFVEYILSGQPEPPMYFANMKRDNKLGPRVLGELPIPPRVTISELAKLDPKEVAIIDTRNWDDFRAGHIPGSLSFPLTRSFNTNAGSMVKDTEDIFLVVEDSHREGAVRELIRVGLDRISGWLPPDELNEAPGGTLAMLDEVDVGEATELMESQKVSVLDVRRATEFAGGHMPGATNIAHTRLAARLDEVPRDAKLLVNCLAGARSACASAYLKRAGYDVINLKGGMTAWEKATTAVEI
ncbi:MAG: MBL fold metallo-hydrolase, partial [Planctomycetota bacterium]